MVGAKNMKKSLDGRAQFKKQENFFVFCMLVLPFVQWLVFWLYVNFQTIALAFQDQRTELWTLQNFGDFWVSLTQGGDIAVAVSNTFKYFVVSLVICMPASLVISYFLFKEILGFRAFRFIFYLPSLITGLALVAVYKQFVEPGGVLDKILQFFGGNPIPEEGLFASYKTATPTIIGYAIWTGLSGSMLIFSGAMARVPGEVLEAAKLDGCSTFRELISIILPLIWPTLSTQIIFAFTGIFGASGPILLFTGDGSYDTTTISFWIFQQVYGSGGVGGAGSYNLVSAAGLCFTAVAVPIILTCKWLTEKVPSVEY